MTKSELRLELKDLSVRLAKARIELQSNRNVNVQWIGDKLSQAQPWVAAALEEVKDTPAYMIEGRDKPNESRD